MSRLSFSSRAAIKILFQLLIFLIPTQLGLHFWPEWAHIFGIRVDYLSPTIYLTDLFIFTILFLWLVNYLGKEGIRGLLNMLKKYMWYLLAVLIFAFVNSALSQSSPAAIYKWVKIFELSLFAIFIYSFTGDLIKLAKRSLVYSLIAFSLIGITQFVLQKTIGGPFYFLGERSFSVTTPGIALAELFGKEYLRAYSTFSHPNSFAGYLILALVFIKSFKKDWLAKVAFFLGLVSLFLTFSQGAIYSLILVVTIYFLTREERVKKQKAINSVFIATVLITGLLLFVSNPLLKTGKVYQQEVQKRLLLTDASRKLFLGSPLVGVGANNFVVELPKLKIDRGTAWTLQPVHNIYLLVLTELGVLGASVFIYILFKSFQKLKSKKSFIYTASLLLIILTGLADHYWLTLQQNQLLFSFVLGLSLRNKNA